MFTRKELGLDLPYRDHLLSQTLFLELFQNNLVSAEGEIKGTSEEFNKYRSILARRYAERTAILYEMRSPIGERTLLRMVHRLQFFREPDLVGGGGKKQLVTEAEKLLKIRDRSPREEMLLKNILDELDLELTGDEIITPRELKPPRRYLGSPEPMLSIFEHKLKEEEHRRKLLYEQANSFCKKGQFIGPKVGNDSVFKNHITIRKLIAKIFITRPNFVSRKGACHSPRASVPGMRVISTTRDVLMAM
ncbi:uncharacterized protein TNIN_399161 [Trichonephila inaurata madagascariensis]|uniref:Uncharacterized protein n=1 Tax=Trichonephila inaurata madagascariensis TaxID=2747483 RepID=A0A8X6XRS5_9ARAC|nr:uncharacterized protein TNIN_399161 [Trichonephila inaurata madagascariensis]